MSKVRIGIIGTGVGIRTHYNGFLRCDDAEVVAICGSSLARSEEFAKKYNIPFAYASYKELCNDPNIDLVCITSPNVFHFDSVRYAIESKKHFICEKPLSHITSEIDEMAKLAKDYDRIAIIDHQLRYNPYMQKIREIISEGELGNIYHVRLCQQGTGFAKYDTPWCWSFDGNLGGGVRLAMASHFTDLLQFWFGNKQLINVSGYLNPVTKERTDSQGIVHTVDASTICSAQMLFEKELCVQYYINAGSYTGSRFDVDIFGDKGEVHFSLDNKLKLYKRDKVGEVCIVPVEGVFEDERENKVSIFSGSFRYFAPKIINAVKNNDMSSIAISTSFSEAQYNTRLLDAIMNSANSSAGISFGSEANAYV